MGKGSRRGMSNSERVTFKPTIVHSLILGSGKRVDVNLDFDQNEWLVHEPVATRYLDGFALNFERLKSKPTTTGGVSFTVACGETSVKIQFDGCETSARLRLGPLLSTLLNETKIFSQTRSPKSIDMPSMESLPAVSVRMRNYKKPTAGGERDLLGTKTIQIDDGMAQILPEIYGLHSPFFRSLFFGDFKEFHEAVVTIGGISRKGIQWLSRTWASFKESNAQAKFDLMELVDIYRIFDRFMIPIFGEIRDQLITLIRETNDFSPYDFDLIVELAEIECALEKGLHYVMDAFLGRFAFAQCLSRFLSDYIDSIDPELAALVCKRMSVLLENSFRRPKFYFEFVHGEIVVEVPTDIFPQLEQIVKDAESLGYKHLCTSSAEQWVYVPKLVSEYKSPDFLVYNGRSARVYNETHSWIVFGTTHLYPLLNLGLIVSGNEHCDKLSVLKSFKVVS